MDLTLLSEESLWSNVNKVIDQMDISTVSIKEYKYRIKLFVNYVKTNTWNRDTYLEYKRYLKDNEKMSLGTKSKYLSVASKFLKEMYRLEYLDKDYTVAVKGFSKGKTHKKDGFTADEMKILTASVGKLKPTKKNIRLRAIFALLVYQGMRQVEIVRLNLEDIKLLDATALVQGKGQDDKELIHLSPKTVKALGEHITHNNITGGAVFKGIHHKRTDRITTRTIKDDVKDLTIPLGIKKTVHGFRHYYITTLLQTLKIKDVRKFSRHKNLEMLVVYDDELDVKHKSKTVFDCFADLEI